MLFNSIEFLLFFPVVVALYYAIPHRYRWAALLFASYYFYAAWKLEYLVLIIASTLVDYVVGRRLGGTSDAGARKRLLALSLATNLGILFGFKYFNFFSDSVRAVLEPFNIFSGVPHLDVLLPVGISFYTFQTLSYTLDVYFGKREPEHHLGYFALFVSFFPQLVAGPIERSSHLLPQFRAEQRFSRPRAVYGLRLMLWGFFKKIVIADNLALFVDQVYGAPGEWHGVSVLLATYFFAIQIFCDFSAYTDIARGSARIMGYDLMENFERPYFARSIREFWQRWHISLSTWFRDYLYIPLGGNRVVKWRWYYNLMVVFVVSGLWHGAAWTFVIWGFLHGSYLVLSLMTRGLRDAVWAFIGRLTVWTRARALGAARGAAQPFFAALGPVPGAAGAAGSAGSAAEAADGMAATTGGRRRMERLRGAIALLFTFHLVVVSWVFFRAQSFGDAMTLLGNLVSWTGGLAELASSFEKFQYAPAIAAVLLMEAVHTIQERRGRSYIHRRLDGMPALVRWALYYGLVMYTILFGQYSAAQQFIYFQF